MAGRRENAAIITKSMKFQLCPGWISKNLIDLDGISGYNNIEVIYLLGMAFAFPTHMKRRFMADGCGNKECGQRNRLGRTV